MGDLERRTSEFTHFNLVIGNNQPSFDFHPVARRVEQLAAAPGNHLFHVDAPLTAVKPPFPRSLSICRHLAQHERQQACPYNCRYRLVSLVFGEVKTISAPNS